MHETTFKENVIKHEKENIPSNIMILNFLTNENTRNVTIATRIRENL